MEARNKPFPKRLRELLDRKGETQGKLADYLGVKRQTIGYWKDGVTSPDVNGIIGMADYYNVSTDFLLGRTDVESPKMDIGSLCKTLGLSEEIVETLKLYHSAEGNDYLKIINKLLLWMGEEK